MKKRKKERKQAEKRCYHEGFMYPFTAAPRSRASRGFGGFHDVWLYSKYVLKVNALSNPCVVFG